jgi:hypothetical protein
VKSRTLHADPNLPKDLIEVAEPRNAAFKMEREAPILAVAINEKVLPQRKKLLTESALPKCNISKTEQVLPKRTEEKMD